MEWQRVILVNVLRSLESGSRPRGGAGRLDQGVPSLGGEHLGTDGGFRLTNMKHVPESHFLAMNQGAIQEKDILLVKDGATTGKVALIRPGFPYKRAAVNEHVFILRVDQRLADPAYIFYYLFSSVGQQGILRDHRGATIGGISRGFASRMQIPLPPVFEQRRIVEILDQADRLRRLRAEADAKADRILPALFLEMFGDPATNPKGWPVKRFEDICHLRLGKMLDAKQQTGEHRRLYLRNANVYWDALALEDVLAMDFNEADRDEFRLQTGDVLICEGGEVGRCAIWNDELPECYFQKALHRARPVPGAATSEFVVCLLWELAKRGGLQDAVSKVTFAHLTGVKLKALRVPVPPFALQEQFAARVRAAKCIREKVLIGRERLDELFRGLVHRAFTGVLTASWREAHMKELLREMEQQAKALAEVTP